MSTVIRIGAILALAIFSVSAQADIIGKPRIIDGDTIEIAGDTGSSGGVPGTQYVISLDPGSARRAVRGDDRVS